MKPTYKELLEMSVEDLANLVVAQGAKIESLEASHKDMKLRNSLLRERKDLPLERLTTYNDEIRAQAIEDMVNIHFGCKDTSISFAVIPARACLDYANKIRGEK